LTCRREELLMKVLIATAKTQGDVPGDYFGALDGELVRPLVLECCSPDDCGCGRGFPGLASSRATTSAVVCELAHMSRSDLTTAVTDSLRREGWLANVDEEIGADMVEQQVALIEEIGERFPTGTVVGRHGEYIYDRARYDESVRRLFERSPPQL
jgi:hypothetical protein